MNTQALGCRPLYEEYRPRTWNEVVAQDKAIKTVKALAKRGLAGRAYWISGQSGSGKTTIARLIAREIADAGDIVEMDGGELTVSALDKITQDMHYLGGLWGAGKTGRVYIINESHGLNQHAERKLLTVIESLPAHVAFIFTTTCEGQQKFEFTDDASPLLSRCVQIKLARRDLAKAFASRAKEIAISEGLDGQPDAAYLKLARDCQNNMREMLQRIESGEMIE